MRGLLLGVAIDTAVRVEEGLGGAFGEQDPRGGQVVRRITGAHVVEVEDAHERAPRRPSVLAG